MSILVFGASGFTGGLIAESLATRSPQTPIILGGRPSSSATLVALQSRLVTLGAKSVSIGLADITDRAAMDRVFERAAVCISAAGPFTQVGLPVLEACIRAKVDYTDITGETPFVRESINRFHGPAAEAGVRIVHCSGFDSVPSDIGTLMLAEEAARRGTALVQVKSAFGPIKGSLSGGTVSSMMTIMDNSRREAARCSKNAYYLVDNDRKGADGPDPRSVAFDAKLNVYTAPFFMSFVNSRVVRRSHSLSSVTSNGYGKGFSYVETMYVKSWLQGVISMLLLALFAIAVSIKPLRRFLPLPKPGEGPSLASREKGFFNVGLVGTTEDGNVLYGEVRAKGDPGYLGTGIMASEAGLHLLATKGRSGNVGGVLTPATALGMAYAKRLAPAKPGDYGVSFNIVDKLTVFDSRKK
jgi:short subunit dehydrogenase-like uncharacterized protein